MRFGLLAACAAFAALMSASAATRWRVELQQPLAGHQLPPFTLRVDAPPSTVGALRALLRARIAAELRQSRGDATDVAAVDDAELGLEVFDARRQRFVALPSAEDAALRLGRRARLSVSVAGGRSKARLALPSREFGVDAAAFTVGRRRVFVGEVGNSGKGTGLTTWDGSVVLAKYLEHQSAEFGALDLGSARVVELGAGTGLVGLSAALLGAKEVVLTDLDYTMENLARNVDKTLAMAPETERITRRVTTKVLDWFNPPTDLGDIDLILASDVVWIEELIAPLVGTMSVLMRHSTAPTRVLMSHQTRSLQSDQRLFDELQRHSLRLERVTADQLHPEFVSDRISVFKIERSV